VFGLNGNVWATRFIQRDAVCLDHPRKRIDIGIGSPHDGLVCGEKIFFTTVDGHILTANRNSLPVNEVVNLNAMSTGSALLGWCRGLFPVDKTKLWVGFTRVRKTKFQENLLWVRNVFREGMAEKPTHLALYDIASRSGLQEIDLEKYGMNVVFSIFQASRKSFQGEHSVPSTLEFGDGR
jgi:hypothetical protein